MEFYDDSYAAVVRHGGADLHARPNAVACHDGAGDAAFRVVGDDVYGFLSTVPHRAFLCHAGSHQQGRAAWNIVTSTLNREAQNFGLDRIMDPELRYDHADEVVQACCALWESWEAGCDRV